MKKLLTLSQWIIEKANVDSYRAGRLHGEKHPRVDQSLLNELGGMTNLLKQAEEMERDADLSKYIRLAGYGKRHYKNSLFYRDYSPPL